MKLEVGMYVRTDNGLIGKIIGFKGDMIETDNKRLITYKSSHSECKIKEKLIDLIEVGDYVNGSKVIDISIIGKDKEKWVWVEQMEDTDNKYGDDYVGYNNEQIKSIVTHKQMEQMAYIIEKGDDK